MCKTRRMWNDKRREDSSEATYGNTAKISSTLTKINNGGSIMLDIGQKRASSALCLQQRSVKPDTLSSRDTVHLRFHLGARGTQFCGQTKTSESADKWWSDYGNTTQ